MPVAPDIAEVMERLATAAAETVDDATLTGRRHHERDAVIGTPLWARPAVRSVEEITVPGGAGPVPARVYRPLAAELGPVPTLLWLHGGGWVTGSLDTSDTAARFLADRVGAVVVSLDYRLAPEHVWPAGLADVLAALTWVRDEVARLGGDPARLAVGGDSAGGNLAAIAAQAARDEGLALAAQLLVYPVVDLELDQAAYPSRVENESGYYVGWADIEACVGTYLAGGVDPRDPRVSPLRGSVAGVAPAVVVTAEYDTLRDEAIAYVDALRSAGVPVVHESGAGLVHGALDMIGRSATAHAAMGRAAQALRDALDAAGAGAGTVSAGSDAALDRARHVARFVHPGKTLMLARAALGPGVEERLSAAIGGCDVATYRRLDGELALATRASATAYAAAPGVADLLRALPFRPGERVVVLGDSITDDACSWAEQLRVLLELADAGVEVVNVGVTGATTHDHLARADLLTAAGPDWVLQMLGTNDARRHGREGRARMLSLGESVENLVKLEHLVTAEAGARLVRLTPPPVVEAKAATWQPFLDEEITWRQDEVAALAAAVLEVDPAAVDVHGAFLGTPRYEDLLPDGVHPTVDGQRIILDEVVRAMAWADVRR